jgi:hypothetical protein
LKLFETYSARINALGRGKKNSVYLALKPQNAKPENREITKCKKKKRKSQKQD